MAIVRDFTNHLEDIRKFKRKLSNNTKQYEVYENRFVHVSTNCVRNIVDKSTVTQYLDKRTRDLQQPRSTQAICYVIHTLTTILTCRPLLKKG